jgi:hypothetical protein
LANISTYSNAIDANWPAISSAFDTADISANSSSWNKTYNATIDAALTTTN